MSRMGKNNAETKHMMVDVPPECELGEVTASTRNTGIAIKTVEDDEEGISLANASSGTTAQDRNFNNVDTTSMIGHDDDLRWSLLSNSFFLAGGISYLILSIWDWKTRSKNNDKEDLTAVGRLHVAFTVFAPMVYLINSIIDIKWAIRTRQRELQKQEKEWGNKSLEADEQRQKNQPQVCNSSSSSSPYYIADSPSLRKVFPILRKHAAHRRALMAALTFGLAAFLGVLSAILRNKNILSESGVAIIYSLSIHSYVLSAIFALTGPRTRPRTCHCHPNNPDNLEDLGDTFFLIGSLFDAMLCDLHFDDGVGWFPILSASLWLLDSFFYLWSDFVVAAASRTLALLLQEQQQDEEGETSVRLNTLAILS